MDLSKITNLSGLVGREITVQTLDRSEMKWVAKLHSVGEKGITLLYEARGSTYIDFIIWDYIHFLSCKISHPNAVVAKK